MSNIYTFIIKKPSRQTFIIILNSIWNISFDYPLIIIIFLDYDMP